MSIRGVWRMMATGLAFGLNCCNRLRTVEPVGSKLEQGSCKLPALSVMERPARVLQ